VGLGVLDRDRLTNVCKEHRATAEAIAAGSPELAAEIALKRVRTVWTNEVYLMENVLEPLWGLKR
jgi:DNA-binding GntR family transcriptional regulator